MSMISTHQISCPSCSHTYEFKSWDTINVDLNPKMRKEAISGRIFKWECPHCGKTFTVPYVTLYHDMMRQFMIYHLPDRPADGKGLRLRGASGPYKKFDGYIYRCTYDIHDFQEKIQQLESGLNDCAIELLKRVALYNKMPEGLPAITKFRFGGVFPEQGDKQFLLFHCVSNQLKESKVVNIPFSAYEDLAKGAIADKIFEQDADFPEVSQWFLDKSLKA